MWLGSSPVIAQGVQEQTLVDVEFKDIEARSSNTDSLINRIVEEVAPSITNQPWVHYPLYKFRLSLFQTLSLQLFINFHFLSRMRMRMKKPESSASWMF